MNAVKKKLFMFLLSGILLIGLTTGCNQNKDEDISYTKLLEEYLKDDISLNNQKFPAEYSTLNYKIYSTSARGNISSILYDLDGDGELEGIRFSFGDEAIDATLLEVENDQMKEVDSDAFLNLLPEIDQFNITVFALNLNHKPYFFLEINGSSSLLSNGMYYEFRSLTIEDNQLVVSSPLTYGASYVSDEDSADYISKVKRMGLSMNTISSSIFSQNKEAIKIFEINRTHLSNFDVESVDQYDEKIQYGETEFKDYIQDNYMIELKNVQANIDTENMEYEFKASNLGSYSFDDHSTGNSIKFELQKKENGYYYVLEYYPSNSTHASEELWGTWDITKTEFSPENENTSSLAEYKFKNIKYGEGNISFEIEAVKVNGTQYKDYVIPNGSYTFIK